jgi:hypothetical protein
LSQQIMLSGAGRTCGVTEMTAGAVSAMRRACRNASSGNNPEPLLQPIEDFRTRRVECHSYLFSIATSAAPSGIQMPESADMWRKSSLSALPVLTVVAVLMIGMVAKLDATMQLFHLSR